MNERIREIRKEIGLNQVEFATRLGVTGTAISRIEVGERALTEQMLIAICREYNVNEKWLRTGHGEMFVVTEDVLIRQLSDNYNLDELDRAMLKGYLNLPGSHKAAIKGYLMRVFNEVDKTGLSEEVAEEIATASNEEITATLDPFEAEIEQVRSLLADREIINEQAHLDALHNQGGKKERLSS